MIDSGPIADRVFYATKDGDGFEIRLAVGRPYRTESGNWACPVAMDGFHERLNDIHGESSWQALMLAIRLVKVLLGLFIESGGKIYWAKDGQEMSLNELFLDEEGSSEPEVPQPDGPLTPEQEEQVRALSADDLIAIDDAILANCSKQFRKVARVVGRVMNLDLFPNNRLPDVFYAQRIYKLAESGKLRAEGMLGCMRFCEVRLPVD